MALVKQGDGLLIQGGALASGSGCCCSKCSGPCDGENPCPEGCVCVDGQCVAGGACCLPERCVYSIGVAWMTQYFSGPPYNAPAIDGWSVESGEAGGFGTFGSTYTLATQDDPCDLFTETWQAALDDFRTKAAAAASAVGYTEEEVQSFLDFQVGEGLVTSVAEASCQDGLSQQACESQGGTYNAGKSCGEICCGPCDGENPCPEGCACVDGECRSGSFACCAPREFAHCCPSIFEYRPTPTQEAKDAAMQDCADAGGYYQQISVIECVGVRSQEECASIDGDWKNGEPCDATICGGATSPCGENTTQIAQLSPPQCSREAAESYWPDGYCDFFAWLVGGSVASESTAVGETLCETCIVPDDGGDALPEWSVANPVPEGFSRLPQYSQVVSCCISFE